MRLVSCELDARYASMSQYSDDRMLTIHVVEQSACLMDVSLSLHMGLKDMATMGQAYCSTHHDPH